MFSNYFIVEFIFLNMKSTELQLRLVNKTFDLVVRNNINIKITKKIRLPFCMFLLKFKKIELKPKFFINNDDLYFNIFYKNITAIYISGKIKKISREDFAKLENLKKLVIAFNTQYVDDDLAVLSNSLKELHLFGDKRITYDGINKLKKLEVLSYPQSIKKDGIITLKNLKKLDISYHEMSGKYIENLTSLISLNILGVNSVFDCDLKKMSNLKELNCNINITDKVFEFCKELEVIKLNKNKNITIKALKKLKNLIEIHIQRNQNLKLEVEFKNIINYI